MARINSLTNFLNDVSSAIKQKTGDNTPIPASEFDTEILSIETAGIYQQKTLTITQNGQTTLTPDTGFDAMDQVAITVNVPIKQLQSKTVSVTSNGNVTLLPDTGYDGFSEVNLQVNVPQQGGSGDVKLFTTIESMQSDPDPEDGNLAIVYNTELANLTENIVFQKCSFPSTVTLSSAVRTTSNLDFRIENPPASYPSGAPRIYGTLSKYELYLHGSTPLGSYSITYESSNGTNYHRTEFKGPTGTISGDEIDFGTPLKFYQRMSSSSYAWKSIYGEFMKIKTGEFDGLFQYSSSLQNYVIPITQLSAIPEDVYGNIFIGKQGVEQGTLNVMTNLNEEQIRHRVTIYESMSNLTPIDDITNMAGFFAGSSNLVNLPFINLSNVTNVSRMFNNCNNLSDKSLSTIANMMPIASQINNSLVYNVGITSDRFSQVDKEILFNKGYLDCNPNTQGWSNQYLINDTPLDKGEDYDIYGNTLRLALRTTYNNAPSINVSGTGDLFLLVNEFRGCNVVSVDISNLDTSQVYSTQRMFDSCKNLQSSPNFNTLNVTDMSSMFYNCGNLTSVSDYDTSNVTNMAYMFSYCVNLTTQPNFDTSNVTDMSYMFIHCNKLTSLNNWDGSNVTNMLGMFTNCVGLSSVSNIIIGSEADVAWMFEGCYNLRSVSNLAIGATNLRSMFSGCSNLVTAPDFNASNVIGMYSMFDNCTNLQNVQEYDVSNLRSLERTFANCNKLSDSSIQNIINMCLNSNVSVYKNLMTSNYSSPFSGTNITNTRYQNRWTELSEAGWTY